MEEMELILEGGEGVIEDPAGYLPGGVFGIAENVTKSLTMSLTKSENVRDVVSDVVSDVVLCISMVEWGTDG